MSNKSIPQLTPGGTAQASDLIPISRGNQNYSLSVASLAAAGPLKTVTVDLSASDILSLDTTPITVLPGVPGHAYAPIVATLAYKPGTKAYVDTSWQYYGAGPSVPAFALTSVDVAVTTTYSLTGTRALNSNGVTQVVNLLGSISGGGSGAYANYFVGVQGFDIAGNNGAFYAGYSDTTFVQCINPAAVTETHAGTITVGTAVYHGTIPNGDSNFWANQWVVINSFSNPANNGIFWCVASDANSLTLASFAAVAETKSAIASPLATNSTGQQFALVAPYDSTSLAVAPMTGGFQAMFSALNFLYTNRLVIQFCGSLLPQVSTLPFASFNSGLGTTAPGYPIQFALVNNPNYPTPSPLTEGDGTFTLSLTYLDVQVA